MRPLIACAIMAAIVLATRALLGLAGVPDPIWHLVASIAVGVVAYVAAAFVVCADAVRDLLALARSALRP